MRIIIVGGGFVGIMLAKALDSKAEVTLIEARGHFAHTPALVRAIVEPQLLEGALIPYDNLLKRGGVVQARASSISASGVTLEDGQHLAADYIVVATGSEYAQPFKPAGEDIPGYREAVKAVNKQLQAASSVAIVGAGAVGTELAGEIAYAMPGKKVTLISNEKTLFPLFRASFGNAVHKKLENAGVTVLLDKTVENLQSVTSPYAGTLQLSDGSEVRADLIFPVIGSRATSDLLEPLPGVVKSTSNRVKTDEWMRPSSIENIFAAGDVVDVGDAMTVVATYGHVAWLGKTLKSLIKGKELSRLRKFKPTPFDLIIVPLGPKIGASVVILFTAGNWLTRKLKGDHLFIPKFRKLLNQQP